MYQHIFVPVDCSEDARRFVHQLAHFAGPLISCRVTLAAPVTPTDNAEVHAKRVRHAEGALSQLHNLLLQYGVWACCRVVEGNDHADAFAEAICDARYTEMYDLIVMGTYQTRPEDLAAPCKGSLADQVCRKARIPVLILPQQTKDW